VSTSASEVRATPFAEPFARFGELLARARAETEIREPTAMSIATVGEDGRPSLRMVLLKDFDERGFVFYTNLGSRKARELAGNPHAALCFHWQPFEVQVRIEGRVVQVTDAEADAYYASRARGSRVGAWASIQSTPLPSYDTLVRRVEEVDTRFGPTGEIPRPPFWSGFRVVPSAIEFWQGRPSRLHERDVYTLQPGDPPRWSVGLLFP
jgi:pyridoxamine 5'-phosphate oxidase